jgi:hypothetical protein
MNFVDPIRDRKKITQIKNLLRGQSRYRDLLLFVVEINTARPSARKSVFREIMALTVSERPGGITPGCREWI